ncbi:prolyl 4-Hydroxylase alpha-subunit, region [Onchocerca flexuosa]|uniref:Prolyl 4-Hydroxylase alpha-subunit, region n=1 Tax=Onchocerca flexuosa TaxID=387005 RepID=A0A238BWJ1_9BILA|nr:prolyl 4-Hydroxylase alpha-subunit, region [Onchocerca flexuosa]
MEPAMLTAVLLVLALQNVAQGDLFTSIAEMELLLEAEKGIPDLLDLYIERFQQRLDEIKQLSLEKKQQSNRSLGNNMRLITNPVSAYLLIKKLIEEWDDIKRLAGSDIGEELLNEISELRAMNYAKNPTTPFTDPNHPRARNNIKWYEDMLAEEGMKPIDYRRNIPPITNPRPKSGLDKNEHDIYEALCRNEVPVSIKAISKLYCYYKMDRPFLRLAPFKIEILRFSPLVVLFLNVISDEEVKMIQMLATPRVGNYGIGGHYDPHFDFARKEEVNAFQSLNTGNRLATLLFYVSILFVL